MAQSATYNLEVYQPRNPKASAYYESAGKVGELVVLVIGKRTDVASTPSRRPVAQTETKKHLSQAPKGGGGMIPKKTGEINPEQLIPLGDDDFEDF